jgi:hypothetical protein
MKRQAISRQDMARHEAGHVLAMILLDQPGIFSWRRLARYELAHVEAVPAPTEGWDEPEKRDDLIARKVVVALAGGAAERGILQPDPVADVAAIHDWTGAVDFELAHEWLGLQRYDGDQKAMIADLIRLFGETRRMLARPLERRALETIANRIRVLVDDADQSGLLELSVPAETLTQGIVLDPAPLFALEATASATGAHGLP